MISSSRGGRGKLLAPFSTGFVWRDRGTCACRRIVLLGPVSSPFSLSLSTSIHVGHTMSREGAVSWTHEILSSLSPPLGRSQTSWGSPHPIWRGSPGPHPMTSSQAAGELGWPAVTWRLSAPRGWVRPRKAPCGMTCLLGSEAAFPSQAPAEAGGISGSQTLLAPPLGPRKPQREQKQKGN